MPDRYRGLEAGIYSE